MNRRNYFWLAALVVSGSVGRANGAEETEFFETRIRPVLVKHCYECHSSALAKPKGGLVLDHRQGLLRGGDSGPALRPGKPAASLLIDALRYESLEMPPQGKLTEKVIADFERWVRLGATDPREQAPSASQAEAELWKVRFEDRRKWWSLQAPRRHHPPDVQNRQWPLDPLDQFVLAALEREKVSPAPAADSQVLLRRLCFVLTGLPPHSAQVAAFEKAMRQNPAAALESTVDALLDSPHFGERFARHWMDVVRYTDTYGYEWDNPAKGSWEYRDYLIRAFNADVGFDQMIREHLAGDLLAIPRINAEIHVNESLIGPMFYHLGEHRHGNSLNFNGIHQEMINNKIDAFSKAFLGMTVACARCHDHKLDAISQADYYALAGVFMSPRWTSRVIDTPEKNRAAIAELKRIRHAIHQAIIPLWQNAAANGLEQLLRDWAERNAKSLQKTSINQLIHPLVLVSKATDSTIQVQWQKMAADWKSIREARLPSNEAKFHLLADFAEPGFPEGWTTEGDGVTHGYVAHGTPRVSLDGETLVAEVLERGYHTHALSDKLPGAIRLPPQHALLGSHVSFRVRGGEWSGYLVAPQNAFQAESVKFFELDSASPWVSIADVGLKNGVTRVFMEIATSSLNPNFPPRTGLARAGKHSLPNDDFGFNKRSWFSLTRVVRHDAGGTPAETLDEFESLFTVQEEGDENPVLRSAPQTVDEAWQRLEEWARLAVENLDHASAADVKLINWLLKERMLPNHIETSPMLAGLLKQYRSVESEISFPRTVNSMDERRVAPLDYRLNVRGDVDVEGDRVPRDFLSAFSGRHQVAKSSRSGRLELATYLSSPDNPQTARVYVNRLWHWVFGKGIVASPNDFGKLGELPSHPELLDYLANEFVEQGWSTKKMLRRMVLSQTFRQSGTVSEAAAELDPDNRLLHHFGLRRLEAEAIRDSMLAVSGRFDPIRFGRPINPPRTVRSGFIRDRWTATDVVPSICKCRSWRLPNF